MTAPVKTGSNPEQPRMNDALAARVRRDSRNAVQVPLAALEALKTPLKFTPVSSITRGVVRSQVEIAQGLEVQRLALHEVSRRAFDAALEGKISTAQGTSKFLWYAHQGTRGNVQVQVGEQEIRIVTWTHPALQLGLSADLNEWESIEARDYAFRAICPVARARFTQLVPELAGVYEPGGVLSPVTPVAVRQPPGLKSVKLQMTPEQARAFISRMNGVLLITGAPGTGKTTVAFQRIRFLLDQQSLREVQGVPHAPALTRVFLASSNLISYSKRLLKEELEIPHEVVSHVPDFIGTYVADAWRTTGRARPITRKMDPAVERAREAMLNLCTSRDLQAVWAAMESQVMARLRESAAADWMKIAAAVSEQASTAAVALAADLAAAPKQASSEILDSPYRMDALWRRARKPYGDCRAAMHEGQRDKFDDAFASWLFWVYDPLDVLHAYFSTQDAASLRRIKAGTGDARSAQAVTDQVLADWKQRLYGDAELAWIAWLLRFSLPEVAEVDDAFRALPRALPQPDHQEQRRWTHVVIDEAQDLAVQEASLLASFVDPAGALTISADFNQVVSPVHGMTDAGALTVGMPIRQREFHTQYPFRRNLRQAREIGYFLRGFYQSAFGELAPFDAGEQPEGFKPQVQVGPASQFPVRVRQIVSVLRRKGNTRSVAVLFVHDDPAALLKMRSSLTEFGLPVASPEDLLDADKIVVTTVEMAKGLEFDVCVVVGLDDVERAALNFAKNRAYVALSRPTRKLIILCEEDPSLLHGVPRDTFERVAFS